MASPLYPGYYPGTPQPKQKGPSGAGSQIQPTEFNFDQITQQIDGVKASIDESTAGFPRWVYDRIIDDWQQSMKANVSPQGVAAEDLDDYDPASLPGAFGINVDMNPLKWAEDPAKMAQDTVKGWLKAGFNWQDMETRYRQRVWERVFSDNPQDKTAFPLQDLAAEALGANIAGQSGYKNLQFQQVNNPLSLENRPYGKRRDPTYKADKREINIDVTVEIDSTTGQAKIVPKTIQGTNVEKGTIDTMEMFGDSVAKYEQQTKFGAKRASAHDTVAYNGYRAIVTEMENSPAARRLVQNNAEMKQILNSAQAHLGIYESMNAINDAINGKDGLEDHFKKMAVTGKPIKVSEITGAREKLGKNLTNINEHLEKLAQAGMDKEVNYLRKYTDPYTKQIKQLLENKALDPNQAAVMSPVAALNSLSPATSGGLAGRPLKDTLAFNPSIQRTLLRNMENDVTRPGIRGKTLGSLVHEAIREDNTLASRTVVGGMTFVRNTGEINDAMDVLDALGSGKFKERYIWPRIRTYFEASTPAAYTSRFLEYHNHFGLVVKDDERFEQSLVFGVANIFKNPASEAPNKIYGNYFTLRDNFRDAKSPASLAGVGISANLYGGKHFSAVKNMNSIIKANEWTNNPLAVADFMKVIDINNGLSIEQNVMNALGNLNQNSAFMQAFISRHGVPPVLPGGVKDKDLYNFMKELAEFKKWVSENKGRIAINVNENDPKYYFALLTALGRYSNNVDNLSITKKYAGTLEKVFTKLNIAQSKIVNSWVGKVLAPASYAKQVIADGISAFISRTISVVAGGASGGILAPVMAVVEPLIRFIVRVTVDKVAEITGVFYRAIAKADIEGVFKYVDKQVDNFSRVAMIIIGTFVMIVVLPADNFMGAVATTFSPTDNTLAGGIGDAYGGVKLGTGVKIDPIAVKPSSTSCFEFATYDMTVTLLGQTLQLSSWPGTWYNYFDKKAIPALQEVSGGYLDRLCGDDKPKIKLIWAIDDKEGGYCGITLAAGSFAGSDAIIFGHNKYCYDSSTYPPEWLEYLFAHETGHAYSNRVGMETVNGISFAGVRAGGETSFMTYPGHCNDPNLSQSEDFAETIGNWVQVNSSDCPVPPTFEVFWAQYQRHYEYADKVLTRP